MKTRKNLISTIFFRSYLVLLIASVTSVSCSMRRFVLDHHEFFSTQLATIYLDLNHEQKDQFRTQWHRFSSHIAQSKVETVAKTIETLGESIDPIPVSEDLQRLTRQILRDACTDFSTVATGLKPSQLQHLQEKIDARNKTFDPAQHSSINKYRSHKRKELFENLDKWLGGTNETQKKFISEIDHGKDPDGQWEQDYLNYAREAQWVFISMIQNNPGAPSSFEKKCIDYVTDPDAFLTPDSRKIKSNLAQSRQKILSNIFASIDEAQRQHLRKETAKLARELRNWARDNSKF